MKIGFVGLFNQPGYVGEISDESHISRELERLGHEIYRIPRDEWREYVIEGFPKDKYKNVPENLKLDICLFSKWHQFYDGSFINKVREKYQCPIFLWIWDYMPNPEIPEWHIKQTQAADLYLSGELGIFGRYREIGGRPYYFQMDVCDRDIPVFDNLEKVYDVVFTGSCIDQGNRKEYLQTINQQIPVTIFSWNPDEWFKLGFKECYPAVYGEEYNKIIAQSKIVLGLSVEPNCWGYWSNRVGKVLRAGGFLLQEYAPGMETQLDIAGIDFFNSPQEAIEKIRDYLKDPPYNTKETDRFTSKDKALQLIILIQRYLKSFDSAQDHGGGDKWLI